VALLSAATVGDALEFQVFDDFRVADAIVSAESEQTISGNLTVSGILTATDLRGSDVTFRHVKATGISTVSDTTQSTSTTTGAMIVSGGLGVAKNLFVGGSMSVAGTLTYEDVTNSETAGVTTTGGLVVTGLGATFGSGVGIADSIYHIDDSNTAIRFPAADTFTVETAGSERLRVNSSGQLGIGANNNSDYDTNAQNLLLASSGSTGITIRSGGSSDFALIHFADGTTDNSEKRAGRILYGHSDNFMSFHTANEERLRIIGVGGSIGINETTPDSKVDIVHSTVENSATENLIHLRSDPSGGYVTRGLFVKIGRDGAYDNSAAHYDIVGSSGNSGFHAFEVQGDEKLRITKDGQIGIGTNNPTKLLELVGTDPTIKLRDSSGDAYALIEGDSADQGSIRFRADPLGAGADTNIRFDTDGAEALRIDSLGNIGVNQTSVNSTRKMEIVQPSSYTSGLRIKSAGSSGNGAYVEFFVGSANYKVGGDHLTNALLFRKDGTEYMRHDSSGRLLINTTTSRIVEDSVGNGPQGFAQIEATNSSAIMSIISAGTADANRCGTINLGRHRNSTVGATPTIVQSGDALGSIVFSGGDGTDMRTRGATIIASCDGTPDENDMPTRLVFGTNAGSGSITERLRIDSKGGFIFSNGLLAETVRINSTARTGTQNVYISEGNVHYFTSASTGTWKPNFTMSTAPDINSTISTNDTFSVTMIVNKGATTHYADSVQVDGSDVSIHWLGGAPTDGGGTSTFDIYSYTIIKTGSDTFKAFGSVSTYS